MTSANRSSAFILGLALFLGLIGAAYVLGQAALSHKSLDRTITVKGLAEREFTADIVIWPVQFSTASNDLNDLYQSAEKTASQIQSYLTKSGITLAEVSISVPVVTDKSAQQYGGYEQAPYRYTAFQTITVYSPRIDVIRNAMTGLATLGKQGIVFTDTSYQTEYLFTRLNEVKPEMIEEATVKAREVAQKFAEDSQSLLGKIQRARQGQFSISDRDSNNPHIKRVRVVSTVSYYLSD